jgi:hypothetical protein
LRPDWLEYISTEFGPWEVDRFAGDHNTTDKNFNSLFDSRSIKATRRSCLSSQRGRTSPGSSASGPAHGARGWSNLGPYRRTS